jgi:hypothetical protein
LLVFPRAPEDRAEAMAEYTVFWFFIDDLLENMAHDKVKKFSFV